MLSSSLHYLICQCAINKSETMGYLVSVFNMIATECLKGVH